jgi:hypothetical protein
MLQIAEFARAGTVVRSLAELDSTLARARAAAA